jgi:hypothetical protein
VEGLVLLGELLAGPLGGAGGSGEVPLPVSAVGRDVGDDVVAGGGEGVSPCVGVCGG